MGDNPYIGEIAMFGGNFAPRGWAFCWGQLIPISENNALYSLLGTTYGGDGRTTFGLPDLRGRFPVGTGTGPGLYPKTWGEKGGTETTTLSVNQIPAHNHDGSALKGTLKCNDSNAAEKVGKGQSLGTAESNIYNERAADDAMVADNVAISGTTGNTGASQPHQNMPPYLGINYIIALQGTWPSRN